MINHLKGVVTHLGPTRIVIECMGVGYEVLVPVGVGETLSVGTETTLLTNLVVKEDAHILYGFGSNLDRQVFRLLTAVSGVGPRTALRILSSIETSVLLEAIRSGDAALLTGIKGIGQRTASRVILELNDKMIALIETGGGQSRPSNLNDDVILALVNLGYKKVECEKALKAALKEGASGSVEEILKAALRKI